MKRKQFFTTAAAAAALATLGGYGCNRSGSGEREPGTAIIEKLGGMTLEELRDMYREELFDRFLPNMNQYVIDSEYGGFMYNVDIKTGKQRSSDKRAWYEGRGMWVYSYLYNNIDQNPAWLEVARKSKDFILRHQPSGDEFWATSFTKSGEPLTGAGNIYGNLFIAEGLTEYAAASGEEDFFELAKQIMIQCFSIYDSPDYSYHISYLHPEAPELPGTRVLGHWMVFLIGSTHMLEYGSDPEIGRISDRCIDAVMNYHIHPDYKLLNEGRPFDMSLPDNEFAQFAYMGHGIETLWMVMYEAIRRQKDELFREAADAFKRHVDVASDEVYGGYFRSLDHVDNHTWKVDKVLWLQEEVLIGTMLLIEHMNDAWAKDRFAKTLNYVRENFARSDFKFWISGGDRVLKEYNLTRAENYHHPRHLMLNLLSVERMIERGGKVSGIFE